MKPDRGLRRNSLSCVFSGAKTMNGESDILFLILTSHGSRDGLAVMAGRLGETLTPSNLADILGRTGVRHKVVITPLAILASSYLASPMVIRL
jgi:hypothetical protein